MGGSRDAAEVIDFQMEQVELHVSSIELSKDRKDRFLNFQRNTFLNTYF